MEIGWYTVYHAQERAAQEPGASTQVRARRLETIEQVRSQDDTALVDRLLRLGVEVDRVALQAAAARYASVEGWAREQGAGRALEGDELDPLMLPSLVLWERWAPELPAGEHTDMIVQAALARTGQYAESVPLWRQAWSALLRRCERYKLRTLAEVDRLYSGVQSTHDWVAVMEEELAAAFRADPIYAGEYQAFAESLLSRLQLEEEESAHLQGGILQALVAAGRRDEADKRARRRVEERRTDARRWRQWADIFVAEPTPDYQRAKELLDKGMAATAQEGYRGVLTEALAQVSEKLGLEKPPSAPPPRLLGAPRLHDTHKRAEIKVGRNDPCPCGSGKKVKKCCQGA